MHHRGPPDMLTYDNQGHLHVLEWTELLLGIALFIALFWAALVYIPRAVLAIIVHGFH
jgi:hypothetical protein